MSLRSIIDWQLVRGIGQLHLLNRASMFLLVFVPILAALWPGIRQGILSTMGLDVLLPYTWATLFVASLFTILGRTVFQLACPEVVKEVSLDAFVRNKKREYSEAPSLSAVSNALQYLYDKPFHSSLVETEIAAERKASESADAIRARIEQVQAEIERIKGERASAENKDDWDRANFNFLREMSYEAREAREELRRLEERDRGDRGPEFRRRMSIVELGAAYAYQAESRRRIVSMLFCSLFYLAAIGLIALVVVHQTQAVVNAAGWKVPAL